MRLICWLFFSLDFYEKYANNITIVTEVIATNIKHFKQECRYQIHKGWFNQKMKKYGRVILIIHETKGINKFHKSLKTFLYLFIFLNNFVKDFFELDGNTTYCWSSLSHPTFFTSCICSWEKCFFAQVFSPTSEFSFTHLLSTHQSQSCLQAAVLLHLQVFFAHAIQKESLSWSSSDSQAIPHTRHIFSALTFSFCFSFCCHFFGISCVTFPVNLSESYCSDSLPEW